MSPLTCSRCGKTAEPMPRPPFPGDLAVEIQRKICAPCWREWLQAQVNLINENRFVMTDPRHRKILNTHMRAFLSLDTPGAG